MKKIFNLKILLIIVFFVLMTITSASSVRASNPGKFDCLLEELTEDEEGIWRVEDQSGCAEGTIGTSQICQESCDLDSYDCLNLDCRSYEELGILACCFGNITDYGLESGECAAAGGSPGKCSTRACQNGEEIFNNNCNCVAPYAIAFPKNGVGRYCTSICQESQSAFRGNIPECYCPGENNFTINEMGRCVFFPSCSEDQLAVDEDGSKLCNCVSAKTIVDGICKTVFLDGDENNSINITTPITSEDFDTFNPLKNEDSRLEGADVTAEDLSTPGGIISRILEFAFPLAGLILFVMISWGGFEMLYGASTSKAMEAGRQRVTAALIGFFLLFASYWIIQILEVVFGIGILK